MPQLDPDASARETLRLIGPDPQNWVPDREGVDHNVLVVGGGQSGSTFAFALRRAGIGKVSVIDAAQGSGRHRRLADERAHAQAAHAQDTDGTGARFAWAELPGVV